MLSSEIPADLLRPLIHSHAFGKLTATLRRNCANLAYGLLSLAAKYISSIIDIIPAGHAL